MKTLSDKIGAVVSERVDALLGFQRESLGRELRATLAACTAVDASGKLDVSYLLCDQRDKLTLSGAPRLANKYSKQGEASPLP